MKLKPIFLLFVLCITNINAQIKIGDDPQNLHSQSLLELNSLDKALVITRISDVQMLAMTPLEGAMVYNTDFECIFQYTGTTWINLCEAFGDTFELNGDDTIRVENPTDTNIFNLRVGIINGTSNIQDASITTEKLQDGAIGPNKIAENAISDFQLDKANISISGFAEPIENLNLGNYRIINIDTPIDDQDAATKKYVDDATNELNELADGTIYIGDNTNTAQEVSITGDILIDNTGFVTIQPNVIDNGKILDEAVNSAKIEDLTIINDDISATAAIEGSKINPDFGNQNIVTTGTLEAVNTTINGILEITGQTTINAGANATSLPTDRGTNNQVLTTDGAGISSWTTISTIPTLTDAQIVVSDGATPTATTISGDASITNDGTLTIANDAVNSAKIDDGTIIGDDIDNDAITTVKILDANITNAKLDKGNIPLSGFGAAATDIDLGTNKLINVVDPTDPQDAATRNYVDTSIGSINTLNDGLIYLGSATNNAIQVAISGDAIISNTGILTIEDDAINTNKINDETITNIDIATTAAIDGTKINPNFGTQNITTTGTLASGNATITGTLGVSGQTTINTGANSTNLPTDRGTANQVLTTDGAGAANWTSLTGIPTLTSAQIVVANATGVPTATTMTGDASINDVGALTISPNIIDNADISNTAAIDGTKINPNFGTQNITTTGTTTIGANTITNIDGVNGQVLTTNGAGNATWSTANNLANNDLTQTISQNRSYNLNGSNLNFTGTGSVVIGANVPGSNKLRIDGTTRTSGLNNSPGTNNQPSYRFSDDSNTGMYRDSPDQLAFSTGGTEALRINASQNITTTGNLNISGVTTINNGANSTTLPTDRGTADQVLTTDGAGNATWQAPSVVAMGMVNRQADGATNPVNPTKEKGATTTRTGTGLYTVTFDTGNERNDGLYTIQLTLLGTSTARTIKVFANSSISAPNTTRFIVETTDDTGTRVDSAWYYTVTDF